MDIDIVDVTLSDGDDGEARLNLGDAATGVGFAAGATSWGAGDGFIGLPNVTAGGGAAQALMLTQGNTRLAIAIRDTRWDGQAGDLAPGDRAIVSNADAALFLDQSANSIELRATGGTVVKVDGDNNAITLTRGSNSITVDDSHINATFGTASVNLASASLSLQMGPLLLVLSGTTVSIATQSGPPATLSVNGVPVTVP